jgi:hypothetical protein
MPFFFQEWQDLLRELEETGQIDEEQRKKNAHLNIVGIVGSIDNGEGGDPDPRVPLHNSFRFP